MKEVKAPGFLDDFPAIATAEWEAKIREDLKGADYEKRLVWKTTDGIAVRPYYRSDDMQVLDHLGSLPGEAPYIRGKNPKSNDWTIRQDLDEAGVDEANAQAMRAIERGAGAVGVHVGSVEGLSDMKRLLQGFDFTKTAVHLNHGKDYPKLLNHLFEVAQQQPVRGSLDFDPLGYLLLYGRFYGGLDQDMAQAADMLKAVKGRWEGFQVVAVNGQYYHNAGAGIVQELAYVLLQGNEYLAQLTERGLRVDDIAPFMHFRLAVGSDYFLEIAKLRAIKMLWANIVAQYHPTKEKSRQMVLTAESSTWNKGVYDPYVNLLRTATEAMSAAIGGVDSILLHPFDSTFKKSGALSLRLARNQQIILKEESYFDKVVDPAAGSYYVENLTDSIAKAAWELFVAADSEGGFLAAIENGSIADEVAKTCQRRDMDIAMRKQVFVGINQYPNTEERMMGKLQPTAKLSDLGGLRPYRGAQAFEALRLAVENHEAKGYDIPKVFLLTYGNLAMRKARAGFSFNFFGIAAYRVVEGAGASSPDDGVKEALAAKPSVVVLCSSDEEYAELTGAIAAIKKQLPNTLVVVAGNPKEHREQLDHAGTDLYIHLRTNALETLTWFNEKLGIL